MSSCGAGGCVPVGTGESTETGTHTIINIGDGAEVYVVGTGPNPFELRTIISPLGSVAIVQTADEIQLEVTGENVGLFIQIYVDGSVGPFQWRSVQSSDSTVNIQQNLTDVDFTVDIDSLMSLENIGGGAKVWLETSGPDPFQLRSVISPLGTVAVVETADEIQLEVSAGPGSEVFQVDSTAIKSTSSTTYQLVTNLAGDAKVLDGETWRLAYGILVCHPVNVFTVNTWVEWRIETSAGVFTLFDEWQINAPITIQFGEPSIPFSRSQELVADMDTPRMQVNVKMSAVQASATQVELPRWGGDQIAEAP